MNQNANTPEPGTAIKVSPATAGSFVLFVSFFLPWINFLGANVAGFDLHQIWEPGRFAWTIPALALGAAALGMTGRKNTALAQLAGGVPLVFLAVALYRYGGDLFQALSFGGYLTLLSGLFLLCVVPRMEPKSQSLASSPTSSNPAHETEDNR